MNYKWKDKQNGRTITVLGDEKGKRYFSYDDDPNKLIEWNISVYSDLPWEENFELLPLTKKQKPV